MALLGSGGHVNGGCASGCSSSSQCMNLSNSTGQYPPGSPLMLSHGKLTPVMSPSLTPSRKEDSIGGSPSIRLNRESIESVQVTLPAEPEGLAGERLVANVVQPLPASSRSATEPGVHLAPDTARY